MLLKFTVWLHQLASFSWFVAILFDFVQSAALKKISSGQIAHSHQYRAVDKSVTFADSDSKNYHRCCGFQALSCYFLFLPALSSVLGDRNNGHQSGLG